ncbi:MAG: protein-glutamate O-methyltransferase [Rickettsiales bacterium]
MQAQDFQYLADILKKRSGLALTDDKAYLIESRLLPIARAHKLQDIKQLCDLLRLRPNESLLVEITEAMTTNESSFYRDIKPYEALRKIVFPMLMERPNAAKKLRIWSAACSTGQEPYTISMCIKEDSKLIGWNFDIVATDLASKVVNRAKEGLYSQFEAQRGLPIQMLVKYFTSMPDTSWKIKDNIRSMVEFKLQNLLESYITLGKFDIIFCRNVLIYFDEPTKAEITAKMAKSLNEGGVFIIGSTESLVDPKGQFSEIPDFRGAYKLK